jgi:hypothetical protein
MHSLTQNDLAGLARQINEEHDNFKAALQNNLGHARKAGELLLRAKAQLGQGKWLRWLAANCQVPERTAPVYMRLAKALGGTAEDLADTVPINDTEKLPRPAGPTRPPKQPPARVSKRRKKKGGQE